jgi:hypothetical protein
VIVATNSRKLLENPLNAEKDFHENVNNFLIEVFPSEVFSRRVNVSAFEQETA